MAESVIETLRSIPLFIEADEKSLRALAQHCVFQNHGAGAAINRMGEPPRFVQCVRTGSIEAWSRTGAAETVLLIVDAPVVFEVSTAVQGRPSPVALVTREPSQSLAVETAAFLRAVRADAAICHAALVQSSRNNIMLIDRLLDQKLRNAEQRLAQWVLLQHARGGGAPAFQMSYSKRTLALELGMTPANLSRLFNVLREHGVAVDGKTMTIDDLALLRALAQG